MAESTLERKQSARLLVVLFMIAGFFVFELIGARMAKSDVLEADAFHLLMDVLALAISLGAMRLASRAPSRRFTFGLRRAEPLAALANGILVLGVVQELVRDSIGHLNGGEEPKSGLMLIVATSALVVNGLNAWLLHGVMGHHGHGHAHHGHDHGPKKKAKAHDHDHDHDHDHGHKHDDHAHKHDDHAHKHDDHAHKHDHEDEAAHDHGHSLNLRGAWLHLLGDALGSVAAFIAGLAIRYGAPKIVDPIASFVVVAILLVGAIRLIRDAGLVLLEAAPAHLEVAKVEKTLLACDGIKSVKALHVWTLGTGHDAVAARVSANDNLCVDKACERIKSKHNVEYVTLQLDNS